MSKLIIVCGLPGSGKTSLAKILSKELNIFCFHKDDFKEFLCKNLGYSTTKECESLGKLVINLLLTLPEKYIKNSVDVMIESTFNHADDYTVFKKWKNKHNVQIFNIICRIDDKIRKERFMKREKYQARYKWKRKFETSDYDYEKMPGKKILVTTDRPVEKLTEYIIKKLK